MTTPALKTAAPEKVYLGKDGRSNAAKAAKKALGADAKRGLDFDIVDVKGGAVWRARQLDKTALDQPEPATTKTDVPVASPAQVDAEARKSIPVADLHKSDNPVAKENRESWPKAGEPGPSLLARLFPIGGRSTNPPKTAAEYKGADFFTTFLRLSSSEAIRGKHATLAEAAARAHTLREEHPGRD